MIERRYLGAEKSVKKALPDLFPEVSYSELCALLRRRDVKVNGRRVSDGSETLCVGAIVSVYPKKTKEIRVLYEDDTLLACYKPKGIASEGSPSFEECVRAEKGDVRLLHRLDTNTDGVILFAKTEEGYRLLYDAMKEGRITKYYDAEVYGVPSVIGTVELRYYYKKDPQKGRAILSDAPKTGFLPVSLRFSIRSVTEHGAILSVELHKGKMHQIRAMLAHYGYFILGDGKYGSDEINRALGVSKTRLTARAVRFSLPTDSPLHYLNETEITI